MADPICRWRNSTPKTVCEFVSQLPKKKMTSHEFRRIMSSSIYGSDFFHTPYQLACQLGLYYEDTDKDEYEPRFYRDIDIEEADQYLKLWISKYYVPNPFVNKKSFPSIEPKPFLQSIVDYIESNGGECDIHKACEDVFQESIGNRDIIVNALNNFSEVIKIDKQGIASLVENYKTIMQKKVERTDKRAFFETFKETEPINTTRIESIYLPYLTAIRTKPFLLLAGISGTGKSRIVRKLAQATNDIDFAAEYDGEDRWKMHSPTNFCLIQVKPNWHNSMDVVGFKSNIGGAHYEFTPFIEFIAKAWHYPDTPFFLCLDEMNLAPVEEYFAEFLSAIESRSYNKDGEYETDPIIKPFREFGEEVAIEMIQHLLGEKMENIDDDRQLSHVGWRFLNEGLSLPKNLIVMGTVNMDETTFSFSRKVLDRAMSIEMNEVDYDAFLTGATEEDVPLLTDCNKLLVERPINAQIVKNDIDAEKIIAYLKSVNALLEGTPFKLGYRAANEAFLYVSASKMFGSDDLGSALDKFTVMKILSRIEGDDSKLKTKSGDDLLPALLDLLTNQFGEDGKSISVQKLTEMNDILTRDHFVSFWG